MILGVIPARGGSKGLPRKNVRPLLDKPLIVWTVEAARESQLLDRFVVSTDDPELAEIARSSGTEVLQRPPHLATDVTPMLEVLQHVLERVPAEILVLLQPTCPIRDGELIDRCIARFLETGADSLATGFQCRAIPYASDRARELQRQHIPGFFCDDGNVYVMKGDLVRAGDRYGQKLEHVSVDREYSVDIDDEFDLWLAAQILRRRLAEGRLNPVDLRED